MNDKKERIIAAALELFTEKGIDSTSTASIAKKAGIGTGTLFHYFSNKEALVHECFASIKMKIRETLLEIQSEDNPDLPENYWRATINWYLENRNEMTFLCIYQNDPKVNNGKSLSVITGLSDYIIEFFRMRKEQGNIRDFSPEYMLLLAHNSTMLAAQYLIENPETDKEYFIKQSLELFWNGIRVK